MMKPGLKAIARVAGLTMLAAFGLAILQGMLSDDGLLTTAAEEGGKDGLAGMLWSRSLTHWGTIIIGLVGVVAFYLLLVPINRLLAMVATLLKLAAVVATGFTLYHTGGMRGTLLKEGGGSDLVSIAEAVIAYDFDTFHYGLIATSVAAAISFALFFHSRMIPRWLAGYGVLASVGAAIGASAIYVAPPLSDLMFPAYAAFNGLAYVSLMLWLIIAGVNLDHWTPQQGRSV